MAVMSLQRTSCTPFTANRTLSVPRLALNSRRASVQVVAFRECRAAHCRRYCLYRFVWPTGQLCRCAAGVLLIRGLHQFCSCCFICPAEVFMYRWSAAWVSSSPGFYIIFRQCTAKPPLAVIDQRPVDQLDNALNTERSSTVAIQGTCPSLLTAPLARGESSDLPRMS